MVRGLQLRQLLGLVPAIAIFGTDDDIPTLALLVGAALLLVVIAVIRVLSWQRHTYELRAGRIVERSGIVSRTERALEVERIQQVDVERTLLDRVVGTCELRLETAADSGDAELTLRVVSVDEARRLRRLLAERIDAVAATTAATPSVRPHLGAPPEEDHGILVPEDAPEDRAGEEVLVSVPLPHVALAAVTGPRLLAVPATIALLVGVVLENAAPDEVIDSAGEVVRGLSLTGAVVVFVALLVGTVVLAGVLGVLRDGGFTIGQRGQDLVVRRGLTTTRSATVPLRRVQRVTVRRRWLQSALGFASVTVHSAGGSRGGDGSPTSALDRALTVPLLPASEVDALVHRLLDVTATPILHGHPPAARRRAVVRGLLGTLGLVVPLSVAAVVFERWWVFGVVAALLALGVASGLLAHRRLASGADDRAVAGRTGALGTTTEISPLRKTQGTTVRSSWFQRRLGLASVAVHVAGPAGGITLLDLDATTATHLAATLQR